MPNLPIIPVFFSTGKRGQELVCVGSYEKRAVEWLNFHKMEYEWQSKVFMIPSGKTYRPDLYLSNEDKWVEIKGYFRKDAKEKWDWFCNKHINSELWDKNKLKELNIL